MNSTDEPPPSDVSSLVDRRAELLAAFPEVARASHGASPRPERQELTAISRSLRGSLAAGHRVRSLDLRGSAEDSAMARRLGAAEAVHPIGSERDLERRLSRDRRVIVVEHPALPGRPLNVLWVALCRGIPSVLSEILDPHAPLTDPGDADTAVLYSIWNAEPGLSGIGRGSELVRGAAEILLGELPHLATLTTMSPVMGLREHCGADHPPDDLVGTCARYLTNTGEDGRLVDPVARFHMGNGARLWRLLPGADDSERGLARSYGIMANYRYFPEDLATNRGLLARGTPALGHDLAQLIDR